MRWPTFFVVMLLMAACTTEGSPATGGAPSATGGPPGTSSLPTQPAGNGGMACWSNPPAEGTADITFSDQTVALGLVAPMTGMYAHSAVWGDINGDDRLDLYVGTFADRETAAYQLRGATGPSPDRLLVQGPGIFATDAGLPEMFTRTAGGTVADLDQDGDLDIIVSRNWDDESANAAPSQVLRNDGGALVPVSITGLPSDFAGRSVGVLDYDLDGMADLFIVADRWSDGGSVLLRNLGGLRFEDVTSSAGLPLDIHGLGVATADLNGDRLPDLFVAGDNRMFIATGTNAFREVDTSVFAWEIFGNEDDVAGVSVADVNRDSLPDVLLGQHYNSTLEFGESVPVRLYLNRGNDEDGNPSFEDVTEPAGLIGLPTKAPHVEIADLDNDGWPDLLTTASSADGSRPAVFRHVGMENGIPVFSIPDGLGNPQYWVTGPTADVDRDGRLDLILVEWEPAVPSLLLRNESASGHWLEVSVAAGRGFGIGWRVEVYRAGGLGESGELLGSREITVTQGYSAGVAPIAHFGLGEVRQVDIRLIPPGSGDVIDISDIPADRHIRFPDGCS